MMEAQLTPKEKKIIVDEQSHQCAVCGTLLRSPYIFYHILKADKSNTLPALEGEEHLDEEKVKAVCQRCHYKQEISEKVKETGKLIKVASGEEKVVFTGGMSLKDKEIRAETKQPQKKWHW